MPPPVKRPAPFSLRLSAEELEALSAMAAADGTCPSVVVRKGLVALGLDVVVEPRPHVRRRRQEVLEA
jgi:hypothetical protein